jgi:hypothetical protein
MSHLALWFYFRSSLLLKPRSKTRVDASGAELEILMAQMDIIAQICTRSAADW